MPVAALIVNDGRKPSTQKILTLLRKLDFLHSEFSTWKIHFIQTGPYNNFPLGRLLRNRAVGVS